MMRRFDFECRLMVMVCIRFGMETAAWIIGLMAGCLRGMYDHEFHE
jgi:hypothetical protein